MDGDLNEQREWQNHVEYLSLREVWKKIGLSVPFDDGELKTWSDEYPVNIAVLDSGVKETHRAFTSVTAGKKVVYSARFTKDGKTCRELNDFFGHGSQVCGVAAGFPIPSPEPVQVTSIFDAEDDLCTLFVIDDHSFKKSLTNILKEIVGNPSESLPYFVGVAPFANIVSFKVFHDDKTFNIEEAVAIALNEIAVYNTLHEDSKPDKKVHIVCISQALRYNDKLRQAMYEVLNNNMIVVASACNMGRKSNYLNGNIWFPARFGNVISVGSHDNYGQPSQSSSAGREVNFLAPGEEIWGPSIKGMDDSCIIEKDKGTSMSAAIVSGIVALVLAFVHKEKGLDARAKISNNLVMKEILGKMATKSGQHDEVFGYGSLKPLKIFGYGGHVLWNLIESLSGISENCNINVEVNHVSHFVLSETALAMHSPRYEEEIASIDSSSSSTSESLMNSTLDALNYLNERLFAHTVEVIDLRMPVLPLTDVQFQLNLGRSRKLLLCEKVLPIIQKSKIKVIKQLIFPDINYVDVEDICKFMDGLSESIRSRLKIVVMPSNAPIGVLCYVAKMLSRSDVQAESVSIFARNVHVKHDIDDGSFAICELIGVRVFATWTEKNSGSNPWIEEINFNEFDNVLEQERKKMLIAPSAKPMLCVDEDLVSINHESTPGVYKTYNGPTVQRAPSLKPKAKVTVAILGDAVNIHQNEIHGKIKPGTNLKCFTFPAGGCVEKGRYLGTFLASIIAETEGIAPFVDLVYATVINAEAKTKPEWVISALEWIERERSDVDIVVIPLGFDKINMGLFKIINKLSSKNTVVVCAANNLRKPLRPEICYPARYGDVICVGSHSPSSRPSSFSPHGREIDMLALGEGTFQTFSVGEVQLRDKSYMPTIVPKAYTVSGTCVAVAHAAGVIAQIVVFALQCGFERQRITNNTVMRELLKHLTCNFSHDPHSGHGWLKNLSEVELFNIPDYFTRILNEILTGIDNGNVDDNANGDGYGNGDANANGDGHGNGDDNGDGHGNGDDNGDGRGNGDDNGDGRGNGDDNGDDHGNGDDNGDGRGNGDDNGDGRGNGSTSL